MTLSTEITATLFLFGSPLALSIPAAFFSRTAAGGDFVIKVNDLSSNTVISTGTLIPFSNSFVFSLNALQKSIIFKPCCPRAGPTGGLGLAPPAGTWSLIIVITSFAIMLSRLGKN